MPSDATAKFHEYRLDWIKGKTLFYLDGVLQQTFTRNAPDVAGEWLWNNWRCVSFVAFGVFLNALFLVADVDSNGDGGWSAGPPASDSIMKIQKIEMFYNRTSSAGSC